jgi:hypothetical protein
MCVCKNDCMYYCLTDCKKIKCMYVCTCIYVFLYVCLSVLCMYVCTCMNECMHTCMYLMSNLCIIMYVHLYVCMSILFCVTVVDNVLLLVEFPRGSELMNKLMVELWDIFKEHRRDLFDHLFEVRFVTTLSQQAVIALCYRQPLREGWRC